MILPPATLGLLGGGQLGRFFVMAAREMGYRVTVLDPDPHSPAGRIADTHLAAPYDDAEALERMARSCAAVTTEFENVPADSLAYLSKFLPVRPDAASVSVAQNRIAEKRFLADNGFPVGPHVAVRGEADLEGADAALFPAILKVARFGYDGKGQARVADAAAARLTFRRFKGEPCVLERALPLDAEVSCVVARGADGALAAFEVARNHHRNGILDVCAAPAPIAAPLREAAAAMAGRVAVALGYVGVMGVEFFVSNGTLLVNEIAPRPHNSGHHTLDACVASQYEQQVRALCGLPLGEPRSHSAAVMVNLLGDLWFRRDPQHVHEPEWATLLDVPNLRLHLYGKHHARPGRKMGHFTVLDGDMRRALDVAMAARRRIGIVDDAD